MKMKAAVMHDLTTNEGAWVRVAFQGESRGWQESGGIKGRHFLVVSIGRVSP